MSKDDIDFNIFQVYAKASTKHSAFDPTSIMEYAAPDSLSVGSYAIDWNTEFSPLDIEQMRNQYPKAAPPVTELTVGGPHAIAEPATAGEVDSFHFDIDVAATYIMTTQGNTDTVLTLQGPNDPGAVLAFDDDRDRGLNARIVRNLGPGSYWLTVRHKLPGRTGSCSVGIKIRA